MGKTEWWRKPDTYAYKIVQRKSGKFVVLARGNKVHVGFFLDRKMAEVFVREQEAERERLNELKRTVKNIDEYIWRAFKKPALDYHLAKAEAAVAGAAPSILSPDEIKELQDRAANWRQEILAAEQKFANA